MAKIKRPKIYHMCSLGSLMGYGGKKGEWSAAKKLKKIKDAGFDGFVGRVFMVTPDEVAASGLVFACTTDLGGIREIRPKLREIKAAGARCVNVQMLDHDTLTPRAVEVARRLMDAAEDLEMDVAVEMHRDTCTETPEKTYALAAGYEKAEKKPLKMTWDFSHPAVIKHLSPPYWERLAERVDLIQLAQQFHFRPFNGHHAMIPAIDHRARSSPNSSIGWNLLNRSWPAGWKRPSQVGKCSLAPSRSPAATICRFFPTAGRTCRWCAANWTGCGRGS